MVFSSLEFLFLFLPLFLLVYYLLPLRGKNIFLFLGSLVFYGFGIAWNIYYLVLIIASVLLNFLAAKGMEHCRRKNRIRRGEETAGKSSMGEKVILTLSLCYNFGLLLFFKYAGFFVENIILPIGISFYTFQITSYLIDVYRRKTRPEQDVIRLGAYLTMFPQLIAGPIVNYSEVYKRLRKRKITLTGCNHGLQYFTLGLGFKVLLANQLGNLWEDIQTIGYESISTPLAWLGILAYSLQIYFDFYGYSLMAVGLGKLLGFRFPDNFRQPYMSLSMTEFWRRWHITLGRWFREYVYIPLGGNRKGKVRQFFNLLIVWLLTGLWHGANWTFVLWGLGYFVLLVIEKSTGKTGEKGISHLYTMFFVTLLWVLFRSGSIAQAGSFIGTMFGIGAAGLVGEKAAVFLSYNLILLITGVLGCFPMVPAIRKKLSVKAREWVTAGGMLVVFSLSVVALVAGDYNPFIYFNF